MDNTRLMVEPLWFIVPGILATIAFRRLYADMKHNFGRSMVALLALVLLMFDCYSVALYWGLVEALNPVPVIAFASPPSPSIPGGGKITYYLIGGDDKYFAVLVSCPIDS